MREAKCRDLKLLFLNLVSEFDAGDRDGRMRETFKPQHWPHSLFYSAVILFDYIIQIAVRPHDELC